MKKIMVLLFIGIIASLFVNPSITHACSCVMPPEVEEALEQADAVFTGEVADIKEKKAKDGYPYKSVTFQVTGIWKGIDANELSIDTGLGGGDCGFEFQKGKEYLVYANKSDFYGTDNLHTTICSRTNTLQLSKEDLTILNEQTNSLSVPEEINSKKDPEQKNPLQQNTNHWPAIIGVSSLIILAFLGVFLKRMR
ncbi:hypothetical protein [Gracilibacillus kekensis]|uniref:Tissue inhibitor of metalloproteinase n=1 Tax=Gracilibacillus kekensis TaxID=1027249 RepID=A0A1M7QB34_9BACI|nr:hypothetical protein [Gracilibacillus kekensis]SHN27614.1 hypothetical protein SAMN05216179_2983 [Gracilibacillus kekensis]